MERYKVSATALAELGFNPQERRIEFLEENIETFELHVIRDVPVSKIYRYYKGMDGNFYVDQNRRIPIPIDSSERGGGYLIGIPSALRIAVENPNQVVILYSPPGRVDFGDHHDSLYREIERYPRGQLYLMWSKDRREIKNIALTTDNNSFPLLEVLLPEELREAARRLHSGNLSPDKEKEFITQLITSPVPTTMNIEKIIEIIENFGNTILYRSVSNQDYSAQEIAELLRKSLAGELKGELAETYRQKAVEINYLGGVTEEKVFDLFRSMFIEYMQRHKLQTLPLGGSCGGREVSLDELIGMSPRDFFQTFFNSVFNMNLSAGPLSTSWRKINSEKTILKCVTCPVCKQTVDAIIEHGKIRCPHCGAEADYKS